MGDKKIGVVTVTYNSAFVLDGFLSSVWSQTYKNFLLFVVDSASQDSTLAQLATVQDERLVLLPNPKNVGIAEGNNLGIEAAVAAGCEYVLLINNDTEFPADLFASLQHGLTSIPCDAVAPKMLYFDQPGMIWAAGGGFQHWLADRSVHYGLDMPDDGSFDELRQVDYVPTCCVLIRKEVFARVGKMDTKYFVYGDDSDFFFRAKSKGIRLFYLPSARLLHKVSSLSGGKQSHFNIHYCTRNRIYFILKYKRLLRSLPWILLYQAFLLQRLLLLKDSPRIFLWKEKAVLAGVALALSR